MGRDLDMMVGNVCLLEMIWRSRVGGFGHNSDCYIINPAVSCRQRAY